MDLDDLVVIKISGKLGKAYIRKNHYTHGCHNGPMCWGLFYNDNLVGVCAFATPISENVRASVFGVDFKNTVTELHRLHTQDNLPKNAESYFVSRAIKGLVEYKPNIKGILSFADATEGHVGYIYQALNFIFTGVTNKVTFYIDPDGRLRPPRQNGVNISKKEAIKRGWKPTKREGKYRYILIVGNKSDKKKFRNMLKLETQPYPKLESKV